MPLTAENQQSGQLPQPKSGRPSQPAHTVCATAHGACQVIHWKPKALRQINENLAWPALQFAEQFKHAHQVYADAFLLLLNCCWQLTVSGTVLAI